MVESGLDRTLTAAGPLPRPAAAGCRAGCAASRSRRAWTCGPTTRRSAGCSTSRPATAPACCIRIARVLARHQLNLQLAKVSTLGERVEDTFLIDGPELQQNKAQLRSRPS
jgi:[protein-PII] uridylyltransferase